MASPKQEIKMNIVKMMIETQAVVARAVAAHAASHEAARTAAAEKEYYKARDRMEAGMAAILAIGHGMSGCPIDTKANIAEVLAWLRSRHPLIADAAEEYQAQVDAAWKEYLCASRAEVEAQTWRVALEATKRAESAMDAVRAQLQDADVRQAAVAAGLTIIPRKTSLGYDLV